MKKLNAPVKASMPFPVEAIRSYLGMPDPPPPPEPEPPRIKTVISKVGLPIKYSKKNPNTLGNRAFNFFQGKIPFNDWLNTPDATLENLKVLERLLLKTNDEPEKYLKRIGFEDGPLQRGDMVARIHFMKLSALLRGILNKYKQKKYSGMPEFSLDKRRLLELMDLGSTVMTSDAPFFDIMDHSSSPEEMGLKIIRHYYSAESNKRCKGILWYLLNQNAYSSFYGLLYRQLYSPEFLGGYALSMLNCLHLIDLSDPFWSRKDVRHRMDEICMVYQRIRSRDYAFVKNHFPNTVAIFRKKRPPDLLLLHTIYLKHMIFQSSVKQTPFINLLDEITAYSKESGIRVRFSEARLKATYFQLERMPELRGYRKLEEVMRVVR